MTPIEAAEAVTDHDDAPLNENECVDLFLKHDDQHYVAGASLSPYKPKAAELLTEPTLSFLAQI